jgi:hypothetical protein
MEEFVKQLPDQKLQSELENIIANKKPFQNFKFIIEQSELEKIAKKKLIDKKTTQNIVQN